MIVTVCNKITGRKMARGDSAPGSKIARLLDEGHVAVETAPPNDTSRWDGSGWVDDAGLKEDEVTRARADAIARTDIHMARLTEDILDVLIAKGVLTLDDLPHPKAKEKYLARKEMRGQ